MTDFLVRRIARQPRTVLSRVALGVGLAALALAIRLGLAPWIGLGAPFAAFVLAVLVATVFGGVVAGMSATALLVMGGVTLLEPQTADLVARRRLLVGIGFFLASCGFVIWIITLLRAALAREVAAREGEQLLKLELHHRVKNTLAVVQALAHQTFRDSVDVEAARGSFDSRLTALAGAHDLLVSSAWRPVTLEALAAQALAPFRPADPARLAAEGPATPIPPEVAVALTLCLHELATNAAKHGALSGERGHVRLTWALDETGPRPRLELEWRERGGPPPAAAPGEGFGARLLARALSAQAAATSVLTLTPQGAVWRAGFEV